MPALQNYIRERHEGTEMGVLVGRELVQWHVLDLSEKAEKFYSYSVTLIAFLLAKQHFQVKAPFKRAFLYLLKAHSYFKCLWYDPSSPFSYALK